MSEDKDYLKQPLGEFLKDLGARSPTPGGGSAAALVGALGAALARMAVAYTVGKEAYATHAKRLEALLDEFAKAAEAMAALMAEDMAAYRHYAASRRSDAAVRRQALDRAVDVPMAIIERAVELADRFDEIKTFTNPYLLSDLHAAVELVLAAGLAAATSARVNLDELRGFDPAHADRIAKRLDDALARLSQHRDAVVQFRVEH